MYTFHFHFQISKIIFIVHLMDSPHILLIEYLYIVRCNCSNSSATGCET